MPKYQDLSRSLAAFEQNSTLVAAIEMGSEGWLVGAFVPGLKKDPRKKLSPDKQSLLAQLARWSAEAAKAGQAIKRVCVAYEAGRDGVWLARWLREQEIDAYVIHPTSIPVSREHRRAKSDRLDLRLLLRAFLGWLRGEPGHCSMVAIPTVEEEAGKRPLRERETLTGDVTRLINRMKSLLVTHGIRNFKVTLKKAGEKLAELKTAWGEPLPPESLAELQRSFERLRQAKQQIAEIDKARRRRLEKAPEAGVHPMILILARVYGVGLMTAESLVREVLYRNLRDRRAVARYVGLTGSPDESGKKRREQGLAKAGNGRIRRALIQLAWRLLRHQPESALVKWYRARTGDGRRDTRKVMIVALARKLLVAFWELVTNGTVPEGMRLHPAKVAG
jgi:Transposase and inactivated derivatives